MPITYSFLMTSRHKDNPDLVGFKPRVRPYFLTVDQELDFPVHFDDAAYAQLHRAFMNFVAEGLPGENCRLYKPINGADTIKVNRQLTHFLIDHPDYPAERLQSQILSAINTPGNFTTKHWHFDIDDVDESTFKSIVADITKYGNFESNQIQIKPSHTPHCYSVVTAHGFDTRQLMTDWQQYITNQKTHSQGILAEYAVNDLSNED